MMNINMYIGLYESKEFMNIYIYACIYYDDTHYQHDQSGIPQIKDEYNGNNMNITYRHTHTHSYTYIYDYE